ncbi:MAG: hypothetical protein Q7S86_04265 [bacterium]|nr:hypothetical protein [bacterium]
MSHGLPSPGFNLNSAGYAALLVTGWLEIVIRGKRINPASFPVVAARGLRPFFASALQYFDIETKGQAAISNLVDVLHDHQNAVRILESIGRGGDKRTQKRILKALHRFLAEPRKIRLLLIFELESLRILRDFCRQVTKDADSHQYGSVVGGVNEGEAIVGGEVVGR